MKKYLLIILVSSYLFFNAFSSPILTFAQTAPGPGTQQVGTTAPPDGTWLFDNEVTFAGKNAARSKDLFNWVLVNYQWSTKEDTLIAFWAKIRNVVFVLLILVVLASAFLMIVTGGQSLTAMQFIRKFLIVVILITFSYAFIRILYQMCDIVQSFFIKNPDGQIISSRDLLNISFDYDTFEGYRKYGADYNESAFISLLLTKITAATYFVMAGVLIVRKVILWFFITVSPIYPVLLLYFPIRNTAKIWIGEFFRWLLYAPLFAIFLSGLVVLWRDDINVLPFNFYANGTKPVIYPTAINILLGGPGQTLAIDNNINYTDTFAEYIVALIMLWVVIFLPFLLLRIFLDYLSTVNFASNPAWKYIVNNANKVLPSSDFFVNQKQPSPPTPPPPPPSFTPTGVARQIPFPTGQAREIPNIRPIGEAKTAVSRPLYQPTQTTVSQRSKTINTTNISQPVYKSQTSSTQTSQLVNFPIPTMKDVARYESSRLSSQISSHEEISKVHESLEKIANPQAITNPVERQQYTNIREKLTEASRQGEPLATSILNAANNSTRSSNITNISQTSQQAVTQMQETLQKLANPQSITNTTERTQMTQIKEKLVEQSKQGDSYATTILNATTNNSQMNQQMLQKLANPQSITNTSERQQITQLKEKLVEGSKQGDQVATSILNAVQNITNTNTTNNVSQVTNEAATSVSQVLQEMSNPQSVTNETERQQVTTLKEKLTQQSQNGNEYATTILNTINNLSGQSSQQSSTQTHSQIQQIVEKLANPQSITNEKERQQVSQLKDTLNQEKNAGNPVAASILSSVENVQKAQTTQQTALPTTNQVQTVNLEDYEEVKKTWTENYKNVEVPKTLDNPDRTRQQWIQEDLNKTTHAIDLLTSQDQQNVQEGMKEVSSLLPFLLIGGFSQTEVVAYLQAKKHAAEEVLSVTKQSESEEDTLLERTTHAAQTQQVMHIDNSVTSSVSNTSSNEDVEESPLSNISNIVNNTVQNVQNSVFKPETTQTMNLVHFSIPTMRDVAKFEAANMSSQHPVRSQVDQMHDMIQKLANPQAITDMHERETYTVMRQQLIDARQHGDPLAASILNTVSNLSNVYNVTNTSQTSQQAVTQVEQIFQKMAKPELITNETDKQQVTTLTEKLTQQSQNGNQYATKILNTINAVTNQTSQESTIQTQSQIEQIIKKIANPQSITNESERQQITQLKETLIQEKNAGNPIASSLLSSIENVQQSQGTQQTVLPSTNQVQTVNLEDYEEVRKTWKDNYENLEVPKTLDNPNRTREEWIKEDVEKTSNAIELLKSQDPQKKKEGMSLVAALLPFLLLGGFSETEVIAYLQAKLHAGKEALGQEKEKQEDEESKLDVGEQHTEQDQQKAMEVENEKGEQK